MAYPSDLVRTKNWGTEILTDADQEGQLDLIINWAMAAMHETTGHKHDATENEGPKITSAGIANDNVLFDALDDDGDYGLFTGDWSFNEIALVEDSAPATAAGEMKLYTKDTDGQPELFVREESSGDELRITKDGAVGAIAQVVNVMVNAVATGTTAMVDDNSIPQNDEGDQYMSLAITPKNTANKLKIEVVVFGTHSGGQENIVALFQDATANALACGKSEATNNGKLNLISFTHYMTAGTVAETTFKVRAGSNAGATYTFNGEGGIQHLGGVLASSITITEIVV